MLGTGVGGVLGTGVGGVLGTGVDGGLGFVCLLKFNVSFRHCYGHIGDRQKPGDNPLLFSIDSKGSFRCTQP